MPMRLAGSLVGALGLTAALAAQSLPRPSAAPRKDIVGTERSVYSMAYEEVIVRDFFQDRRDGFFLDVGCWHPIQNSNTYYLEERLGWSGIGVDALPEMGPKWRRQRRASKFFNYLVSDHAEVLEPFYRAEPRVQGISSAEKPELDPGGLPVQSELLRIPTTTLTKLLDENGVTRLDFVSIDIEGWEPKALAGFDIDRFKPELVCIEAKPKNRPVILKYFAAHGYQRIQRYIKYDETNYYFTPQAGK